MYQPSIDDLKSALDTLLQSAGKSLSDVDFVLTGISGNHKSDATYLAETKALFGDKPLLKFKHLFGESFAASGVGFYVAAQCLKAGFVPASLFVKAEEATEKTPCCILLLNHSDGKDYSLTLLEK